MIYGVTNLSLNPYATRFSSARFGNGENKAENKAEEKKAEDIAVATAEPDSTSMDAIYRSPQYKEYVEEVTALEKEEKEHQSYAKYGQYWQTALVAGSATAALLGNWGTSFLLASIPLVKGIHTTLKKLGEWDF